MVLHIEKLQWYRTFRDNCHENCIPSGDTLEILRNVEPVQPDLGEDFSHCYESDTLYISQPEYGIGNWSVIFGAAIITELTGANIIVDNLSIGENILRFTVTNGTCREKFDEITITRFEAPSIAIANNDFGICSEIATLNGNIPEIGVGHWELISGTGIMSSQSDAVINLTNLSFGLNVFQWIINNETCVASRDTVSIFRYEEPSQSIAMDDFTICSVNTEISANNPAVGYGYWTVTQGNAFVVQISNYISEVSNLSIGENEFIWTIHNGACPESIDTLLIIRDAYPTSANAGDDFDVCQPDASLSGNNPSVGVGEWSIIYGSAIIENPNYYESNVYNLSYGNNLFQWTITNGDCTPSSDTTNIFRNNEPSTASTDPDMTICTNETILQANTPTYGNGTWSLVQGYGIITEPNNPTSSLIDISLGENIFRWTITNGNCIPSSDDIIVTLIGSLEQPTLGEDTSICEDFISVHASPENNTGSWSIVSGNGSFSNINDPFTTVENLEIGDNTLRWTADNQCNEPVFDEIIVTVFGTPDVFLGDDITVDYMTLPMILPNYTSGFGSENYTYLWEPPDSLMYDYLQNPIFNPAYSSSYQLRLTVTNELNCSSSDTLIIYFELGDISDPPNLFTPNNDGKNDKFVINGIQEINNIKLYVYNSWGNLVYKQDNYQNDWDGHSNVRFSNDKLPDGTYFYILTVENDKVIKKGFVVIRKQ